MIEETLTIKEFNLMKQKHNLVRERESGRVRKGDRESERGRQRERE